ncbi:MAG TPA: hypothetical protein VN823_10445 [Stellaceae bacterium]|nr:hypothetical protein [Stellaceae bacterium]
MSIPAKKEINKSKPILSNESKARGAAKPIQTQFQASKPIPEFEPRRTRREQKARPRARATGTGIE